MKITPQDIRHFAAAFGISLICQILFVGACVLIMNASGGHISEYPIFVIIFYVYLWPIFYLPQSLATVGHGANLFIAPFVGLMYSLLVGLIYCTFRRFVR